MIGVKAAEIGIMAFAAAGLALGQQPLQLAAICLMGLHSTISKLLRRSRKGIGGRG